MEGIPDHREPSLFTRRRGSWSWRLPDSRDRSCVQQDIADEKTDAKAQSPERSSYEAKAEDEDEMGRGDRGVRGSVTSSAVGRKRPRSIAKPRGGAFEVTCSMSIHRSGLGRREAPGPPVVPHGASTPWGLHASKGAERAGNARDAGTRSSIGWQKSVGRIERLPSREIARSRGTRGR